MNKQILIGIIVIALLGLGGFALMQKGKTPTSKDTMETGTPAAMEKSSGAPDAMMDDSNAKLFTVEGGKFYFKPNSITVKKGDTVTITFNSKEGLHDWVVDEFSARTKQIKDGETDKVTFVADKVGTFEYYCSVMQHRKMGMVGKLIVEE